MTLSTLFIVDEAVEQGADRGDVLTTVRYYIRGERRLVLDTGAGQSRLCGAAIQAALVTRSTELDRSIDPDLDEARR